MKHKTLRGLQLLLGLLLLVGSLLWAMVDHYPTQPLVPSSTMLVRPLLNLVVATVLTLLFLPALYAAWFRVRRESPAHAPDVAPMTASA